MPPIPDAHDFGENPSILECFTHESARFSNFNEENRPIWRKTGYDGKMLNKNAHNFASFHRFIENSNNKYYKASG